MGALSDLLQRSPLATPATPATQRFAGVREMIPETSESQESQESQGGSFGIRAHLLHLADAETLPDAIVHRLHADDIAACEGLPDEMLLAYLRALDRGAVMDAGIAPEGYTQAAHCDGCGPVWLWQGAPLRVIACPWCFRRKAAKPMPRPPVLCGDCRHYAPDTLNLSAGVGTCALGAGRALWPMKLHPCTEMRPQDNGSEQANSLLISYSVKVQP